MGRQDVLTKKLRDAISLASLAAGNQTRLAEGLGIKCQAISQWARIPADRLLEVERVTGIPREKLRPDLYREIVE